MSLGAEDLIGRVRRRLATGESDSGRGNGSMDPGQQWASQRAHRGALRGQVGRAAGAVTSSALLGAAERAEAEIYGLGHQLEGVLADARTTDVLVNGADGVWADRGRGLEPTGVDLGGESAVRQLAVRLAAMCGRRLDEASPVADGVMANGVRLHAVLPPIAADGTLVSLRVPARRSMGLAHLESVGMLSGDIARVLRALVSARANVLISGAAGSGKTTLLSAMLALVPASERIVCIEEAVELRPDHPHVVNLQVRRPNVQDVGEVEMSELVRAAMRMRPDRLVLGECRGPEVREVLSALNTGHDGGWATIHANSIADVPARLAALGALAGMSERTVAVQAASALDAVTHVVRSGGRRVAEIGLMDRSGGELVCRPAVIQHPDGRVERTAEWPDLARKLGLDDGSGASAASADADGAR